MDKMDFQLTEYIVDDEGEDSSTASESEIECQLAQLNKRSSFRSDLPNEVNSSNNKLNTALNICDGHIDVGVSSDETYFDSDETRWDPLEALDPIEENPGSFSHESGHNDGKLRPQLSPQSSSSLQTDSHKKKLIDLDLDQSSLSSKSKPVTTPLSPVNSNSIPNPTQWTFLSPTSSSTSLQSSPSSSLSPVKASSFNVSPMIVKSDLNLSPVLVVISSDSDSDKDSDSDHFNIIEVTDDEFISRQKNRVKKRIIRSEENSPSTSTPRSQNITGTRTDSQLKRKKLNQQQNQKQHQKPQVKGKPSDKKKKPKPNPFVINEAQEGQRNRNKGEHESDQEMSDSISSFIADADEEDQETSASVMTDLQQQVMYMKSVTDVPPIISRWGRIEKPVEIEILSERDTPSQYLHDTFCTSDDHIEYDAVGVYTQCMIRTKVQLQNEAMKSFLQSRPSHC